MRIKTRITMTFAGLIALSLPEIALGQTHKLHIEVASGRLRLVNPAGNLADGVPADSTGLLLEIECKQTPTPVNCRNVVARLVHSTTAETHNLRRVGSPTQEGTTLELAGGHTGEITFTVTGGPGNGSVTPTLRVNAPAPQNGGGGNGTAVERPEVACARLAGVDGEYDREGNVAEMVIATDGFVIARPPEPMDENDVLVVHLIGNPSVLRTAGVVRISTTRGVGQTRRAGADQLGNIERHSAGCGWARAELGDFGSGEGKFRITTAPGTNQQSSVDVPVRVNPLYNGAFSFGPIVSWIRDREYTLRGDSTVAEVEAGETEGHYVLSYTHFVWGARDLEKNIGPQINPMVGITLSKPLESIFAGISIDFGGGDVFVVGGAHGREVTRLDERDDVAVGQRLPAGITTVPTREEWDWQPFLGVSIDLRAAVDLFGKVLTGGSGGG